MSNNFVSEKDYNLIEFTINQKDIIKRIKQYSVRNCRKEIKTSYITPHRFNVSNHQKYYNFYLYKNYRLNIILFL
jgi:hypothetical protein